jgi:hypothetical protein
VKYQYNSFFLEFFFVLVAAEAAFGSLDIATTGNHLEKASKVQQLWTISPVLISVFNVSAT